MCNDFSGIITKTGEVLYLTESFNGKYPSCHETIKEKFGLKKEGEGKDFIFFELTPRSTEELSSCRNRVELEQQIPNWNFTIDHQTVPDWFEKKCTVYTKAAVEACLAWSKKCILLGGEILQDLKGTEYIAWVFGSATIKYVSGSATIENVYGSATIENVYGSATIKNVYGSATIENVSGSATIKYVYGSATIENVYGSATIENVSGSATIKYVSGSATIKNVFGSATIMKIADLATATKNGVIYTVKNAEVKKQGKILPEGAK